MAPWRNKPIPKEEKAQLAELQRESSAQREEALKLLGNARTSGSILRRSREKNHYIAIIDDLFKGGKTA